MKAFVTGGTGFIGSRVVCKLVQRGYTVSALVRSERGAANLHAAGAQPVFGDISDRESMRAGMQGSDVVFHIAAWYKIGARHQELAERFNVGGSRNVLGLAHELGVPKIVYTSTVAVFGNTRGQVADESYRMLASEPFATEYDRTKWQAHYEVALPLIEKGAPITIVMPGAVFGPGDQSLIGKMMQAFYKGLLFVFPGPETVLSYTHVDDIAEGHILAAEKGKPGESYIITGPALSFRQIVPLWAQACGRPAPLAFFPARLLHPLAPLAQRFGEQISIWPEIFSADAIRITGATYAAQASKAQRELGWYPRSLEEGLKETFDAIAEQYQGRSLPRLQELLPRLRAIRPETRKLMASVFVGAALGLLLVWKLTRRRK